MKAILLAGGKGTRLRPLTLNTPKPVVPIFDRAFLHYQIERLHQIPDIDEVILSLNYQPRRIEEVFGAGEGTGVRLRYVVEPSPLGTGGAIRYAAQGIDDTIVVFNGDVMTDVDLPAVVAKHRDAPARQTRLATRTPSLAADGGDLAAAMQTIDEIGDRDGLQRAIADAFPGCRLLIDTSQPRFRLTLQQPGLLRPLDATELSDGTLRYLLLVAALFSPRLPPLLVLNEPENSLHPDLIAPLARLIAAVATRTQVWVIAHDTALITALDRVDGCRTLRLERDEGATVLPGQPVLERAAWRWP